MNINICSFHAKVQARKGVLRFMCNLLPSNPAVEKGLYEPH